MPVTVTVDDTAIERLLGRFDSMAEGIAQLEQTMPEELTEWQREDLRRVRTFTDQPEPFVSTTKVWRRWKKRVWRGRRRGRRAPLASHAILSPKLRASLHKRMTDLVMRSITRS
jgi:hypothetical protein